MRRRVVFAIVVAVLLTLTVGSLSASADGHHAGCTLHYIRYGETLYSIGRLYGVNPYAIAMANNLYNPHYIQAGAYLCIPYYGYGYTYDSGYYGPYYGHYKVDGYRYYQPYKVDGYRYYDAYWPYYGYGGYYGSYYGYGWYGDP